MRRWWLPALFVMAPSLLLRGTDPAAAKPAQAVPPQAWILVDADTGAVLSAHDERTLRPPASTIKLLTALLTVERLDRAAYVRISERAASMPARKINVKTDQSWKVDHLLHALLLVSANDAAVALAEEVGGGSLDGYVDMAGEAAARLGLSDGALLVDPAGLDDEFSNRGGSLISARDLAIVARAVLARPDLMAVIGAPSFEFLGGDAIQHVLRRQNRLFELYEGATGMKTGATDKAGNTFVGSATRAGRTMLVVVLNAPDPYLQAAAFLDQGFATPVEAEVGLDHLPPLAGVAVPVIVDGAGSGAAGGDGPVRRSPSLDFNDPSVAMVVFVLGVLPLVVVKRRIQRPRGSRRARS